MLGGSRGPRGRGTPAGGRSGTTSNRNNAAIAAQRKLARLMASQLDDDEVDNMSDGGNHMPSPPNPVLRSNRASPSSSAISSTPAAPPPIRTNPSFRNGISPQLNNSSDYYPASQSRNAPQDLYSNSRRGSGDSDSISRKEAELQSLIAKLQDEIDVLSEENNYLLDKLRSTEEDFKEKQARCLELEKQVDALGEGVSLEMRLLKKREASLAQREQAIKIAMQDKKGGNDEKTAELQRQIEEAKESASTAKSIAQQATLEAREIRTSTSRLMLNPQEKEEVVLKRCWLARYWLLAAQYGVHADVAGPQSQHWHELAPIPREIVIDAGQKAKSAANSAKDKGNDEKTFSSSSDSNIEGMFYVEKGLRDLAALKIEEGVILAMAQQRRPSSLRIASNINKGVGDDAPKASEPIDLTEEEMEDVEFKQNWLVYFWRRAKTNGVALDVADERLQYWINRTNFKPTAQDAVDAERGLMELRKLGVEQLLWEASRKNASISLESRLDSI